MTGGEVSDNDGTWNEETFCHSLGSPRGYKHCEKKLIVSGDLRALMLLLCDGGRDC